MLLCGRNCQHRILLIRGEYSPLPSPGRRITNHPGSRPTEHGFEHGNMEEVPDTPQNELIILSYESRDRNLFEKKSHFTAHFMSHHQPSDYPFLRIMRNFVIRNSSSQPLQSPCTPLHPHQNDSATVTFTPGVHCLNLLTDPDAPTTDCRKPQDVRGRMSMTITTSEPTGGISGGTTTWVSRVSTLSRLQVPLRLAAIPLAPPPPPPLPGTTVPPTPGRHAPLTHPRPTLLAFPAMSLTFQAVHP